MYVHILNHKDSVHFGLQEKSTNLLVGFMLSVSLLEVDRAFLLNRFPRVRKRALMVAASYSKAVIDPKVMIALILN